MNATLTSLLCLSAAPPTSLPSVSALREDVGVVTPMEMSPSTVVSASSPWSLWLLFLLTPVALTTGPAHTTLLFDGGGPSYNLRNCSCSAVVRDWDCDEALASSLCSCHTVLRSALPPAGLRQEEQLVVWVKGLWMLEELLNGSTVSHLQLSFCGINPVDSGYLALLGLRNLRIYSAVPGSPYPRQEIAVSPTAGVAAELETLSFNMSSSLHVTLVDVAVLNGFSTLKAFTVVGPHAHTFSQPVPHLTPPPAPPSFEEPGEPAAEPLRNLLTTFVY